jgi:hypothetical protein
VLRDGLLGRHRDGPDLPPAQPQAVLEEVADLGEATADTGLLLDDGLGLFGRTRWMLLEVLLQGGLVVNQNTLGLVPAAAAEAVQAALAVVVEEALHAATGDTGVGGDAVLGQTVAGQPEDFHLLLDAGVGVVVAVVGDGPQVFFREQERRHGECSRGGSHAWSTS